MKPHETLEQEFAKWVHLDKEGMVACASGTAALHLAFEALSLPEGSEVLVPDFTMIACPRAVTMAGLTPVFVDCLENLLMDPKLVESAIGQRTTAIMPVHIYGRKCNMVEIVRIASDRMLYIVEDRAEYHLPMAPDDYISDAICWSMYRNKVICGEEGGMTYFRNPEMAEKARMLRSQGFTPDHDFIHIPRGHNYRMSDCHAGMILSSLARADQLISKRKMVEAWYLERTPLPWMMPLRDVVWVYDVRVPGLTSEMQRQVVCRLDAKGIAARHSFRPMSMQPEYESGRLVGVQALRMSREVLYLPVYPSMSRSETHRNMEELVIAVESL